MWDILGQTGEEIPAGAGHGVYFSQHMLLKTSLGLGETRCGTLSPGWNTCRGRCLQNVIPSTCPSLLPQSHRVRGGQRGLPAGGEGCGRIPVPGAGGQHRAQERACAAHRLQQARYPGRPGAFVLWLLNLGVGISAKGRLEFRFEL